MKTEDSPRASGSPAAPERRGRGRAGVAILLCAVGPGLALTRTGSIGRAELLRQIQAGDAPLILDVRSLREYRAGHVPGAVHVPFFSVWGAAGVPPGSEERPVIVYCELGPRAGIARAQLWLSGGPPVLYLDGHMRAWRRQGLPLVREGSGGESDRSGDG